MKCLLSGVEFEIERLLLGSTYTLAGSVAAASIFIVCGMVNMSSVTGHDETLTLRVALVFELVLVLFVAAVAFGVVGLGLARTTTVLALLDRTTLGVDMVQFAI